MGCHRSGTNLLYDMLLSSGGFAIYRGYLPIYRNAGPALRLDEKPRATGKRSSKFGFAARDSGAPASMPGRCRRASSKSAAAGGDFIRIVMDAVAQSQQVERWALYDPDNVLHVEQREARHAQCAVCAHHPRRPRHRALAQENGRLHSPDLGTAAKPTAWWRRRYIGSGWSAKAALVASKFPADYVEVRYEDLITNPRETLARLGAFIDHDLDYDRIQSASLGCLSKTNSSFREEGPRETIKPLGRWKERLAHAEVAAIEATVGECLQENGYELSLPAAGRRRSLRQSWMRKVYPAFFDVKLWLKVRTPFGRFANVATPELQEEPGQAAESIRP